MISCHCVKFDTTHIRTVYLSGIQTLYSKYIRTHIKTLPHKIGTETIFKIGNSKIENQIEAEIGNWTDIGNWTEIGIWSRETETET